MSWMDDLVHWVPLLIFAASLAVAIWIVRIHPPMWPAIMLPIALFVHWITFFAVSIDRPNADSLDLLIWANGLAIHSGLTWLISLAIMGRTLQRAKQTLDEHQRHFEQGHG